MMTDFVISSVRLHSLFKTDILLKYVDRVAQSV